MSESIKNQFRYESLSENRNLFQRLWDGFSSLTNALGLNPNQLISLVFITILIGALLPTGLGYIVNMGNVEVYDPTNSTGTGTLPLSDLIDPSLLTILIVVVPLMIILSIAMYFIPKMGNKD